MITQRQQFPIILIVMILALIVATIGLVPQFKEKKLSYILISENEILPKTNMNGLELRHKDKTLANATVRTYRFLNDGSLPITKTDFDGNIKLIFKGAVKILDASINRAFPNDLELGTSFSNNEVDIKPALLNPDDNFDVVVLATGTVDEVLLSARIIGLPSLTKFAPTQQPTHRDKVNFITGFCLLLLYGWLGGAIVTSRLFTRNGRPISFGRIEVLLYALFIAFGSASLAKPLLANLMSDSTHSVIVLLVVAFVMSIPLFIAARIHRYKTSQE